MVSRGYFEIGIFHGKTKENLGTLYRSAYQLGAVGVFIIGRRFAKQASDTLKVWRHLPLREYSDFPHFLSCLPYNCKLVAIEMGGESLSTYQHPQRAVYLLGAEDHGLPDSVLSRCHAVVSIDAVRTVSYNVAVAGSIVMSHRQFFS